jgi:xanthine dehydrogenase accessory factor
VRNPAGLDLGARTAPEVALSILAEIVQRRPTQHAVAATGASATSAAPPRDAIAIDPVCGMEVDSASTPHKADVGGTTYYFCCAACRARFVEAPGSFLPSSS